ncbi:MAG: hypothetical protein ACI9JM_002924 [Halioglobus sp.]|jgi:hypothetical protein
MPRINVEVAVAHFDEYGNQKSKQMKYKVPGVLTANAQSVITTRITEGTGLRSAVSSALIAQ